MERALGNFARVQRSRAMSEMLAGLFVYDKDREVFVLRQPEGIPRRVMELMFEELVERL